MLFWPVLLLVGLLAGTALAVQFPRTRWVVWLFAAAVLAVAGLRLATPFGGHGLALLSAGLALWYLSLRPRLDRNWAPDVARIVTGDVSGSRVMLHDIRAFDWIDRDHARERWIDAGFDLDRLTGADMITSVWGNPKIAHLLVSFGFSDGQRVVFSVEIRREQGELFSNIGGFFRQFELALIAAIEADIVKLRTNHRREDVRLYPLNLSPGQLRQMFLAYVALGNRIARRPHFYNTVTTNCTTVVWQLARVLKPDLRLHRSLLLSGLLPDWLHAMGLLRPPGRPEATLAEIREAARITAKAQAAADSGGFSDAIRGGTGHSFQSAPASHPD